MGPNQHGPFDDPQSRSATPPHRPGAGYSLTESYVGGEPPAAPPYNGYHAEQDPYNKGFVPPRVASPYDDNSSDDPSMQEWRQRAAPGGPGAIRRYQTRKVKLQQGSVLSVEYPVPSAIQNSVQAKYRNDLESGSEEFTHMRCTLDRFKSGVPALTQLQTLLPLVTLTILR